MKLTDLEPRFFAREGRTGEGKGKRKPFYVSKGRSTTLNNIRKQIEALRDDLRRLQNNDAIHTSARWAHMADADSLDAILAAPEYPLVCGACGTTVRPGDYERTNASPASPSSAKAGITTCEHGLTSGHQMADGGWCMPVVDAYRRATDALLERIEALLRWPYPQVDVALAAIRKHREEVGDAT